MKKMTILLCLCALSVWPFAQPKPNPAAKPWALTHATIIDATGAPAQPDMTVVISGERITALGRTGKVRVPKGTPVVDASGKFLIPGLWDMHVHILEYKELLPLFIANGVTGVRDMGSSRAVLERIGSLRREIVDGRSVGPRIALCGPIVDGPKPFWPGSLAVQTEAEGRQAVRDLKTRGADFVKVYALLPREAYFAIADEAKKQGIPFAGHVPIAVNPAEASDAGQRSIEHNTNIDPSQREKNQAIFARFVKNGTWQCPTLVVGRAFALMDDPQFTRDARIKYIPLSVREGWDFIKTTLAPDIAKAKKIYPAVLLGLVKEMRQAGVVEFLAGTDLILPYIFPGFSLHDELALLVQAGLTPLEALQSATRNPARALSQGEMLGTVEVGKIADLVLLDANPLEDIRNTQRIHAVVTGGKLRRQPELQALLAQVEAAVRSK